MSADWTDMELGDFVLFKRGYDLPKHSREEGNIPVVSSSGESGFHNESKVSGPGVVTGRYGTIGQIYYIEGDYWPLNTTLYVEDFKKNDPIFTYYFLKTINYLEYSDKAAVPGINRNHLHKAKIRVPKNKNYQRKLASVLWELDKKISLNTQTNRTLEQIAQAIFKSWFVDFDPVKAKMTALAAGGSREDAERAAMCAISGKDETLLAAMQREQPAAYAELAATAALFPAAMQASELGDVPEGWEVGKLSDLIEFNPKRILKKGQIAPYLDMKNVPTQGHLAEEVIQRAMASGTKFMNGDTLLARITPCLENGKTAFVDFLNDRETGWGSTEYIVMRPVNGLPESLGYLIARLDSFRTAAIQSMTGTSGRQRANAGALANLRWLLYPKALLLAFGKVAESYLRLAKNNGDQNKALAELRDSLLPKLLSGEIDLSNLPDPAEVA